MLSSQPLSVATVDTPSRPVLTWRPGWREVAKAFMQDLSEKGYSALTIRDYRNDVFRLGSWLDVAPADLRFDHLEIAERIMIREGMTAASMRRRHSAFARFLSFLRARTEKKALGPDVIRACEKLDPPERIMVALCYFAGLRLEEITDLEGRDIQLRAGLITTRAGYRAIPVHPALGQLFDAVEKIYPIAPYRPLLPGLSGHALNARTLHARFKRAMKKIGFPDVRPDTLRREAAAFLNCAGTPPSLVCAFLGRDRNRPDVPRRGRNISLACIAERLARLPSAPA